MQIQMSKNGQALVVTAEGRLDAETANEFQGQLFASIDSGETRILLEFSKLHYISSAGLRVLIVTAKRLQEADGQFAICGLTENVASVLKVSGFDSIINIFPDEAAALSTFS